jgi:hypothetical protein
VAVTVHNTSKQPVYDLRIHWVDWATAVQAGGDDQRGTLGPGGTAESERELPGNVTIGQFHAVAESVNLYEAPVLGFYWAVASVFWGGLIQELAGIFGGSGGWLTNRSGWAA